MVCAIALLVFKPAAAVIFQKIFEMAASGTGVTGIVRYLNERELPTPSQYAKFRKLLSASSKDISLSEIVDYIDKVVVDGNGKIVVQWSVS